MRQSLLSVSTTNIIDRRPPILMLQTDGQASQP
jgi:hypothetical protein